jgi:hypothetical protein
LFNLTFSIFYSFGLEYTQGDTIQVVLPSDLCPLFESKLEEGTTYIMKNFKVQPNDLKVKFCTHPFTLVAVGGEGGSDIIPTKLPNIPSYKFNFKSFDDIKNGKYRHDLLVGTYSCLCICTFIMISIFLLLHYFETEP